MGRFTFMPTTSKGKQNECNSNIIKWPTLYIMTRNKTVTVNWNGSSALGLKSKSWTMMNIYSKNLTDNKSIKTEPYFAPINFINHKTSLKYWTKSCPTIIKYGTTSSIMLIKFDIELKLKLEHLTFHLKLENLT